MFGMDTARSGACPAVLPNAPVSPNCPTELDGAQLGMADYKSGGLKGTGKDG